MHMGSNYNNVDKRRAVRAARREEVGDRGGLQKWVSFVLKFCFCFWALLISFFSATVQSALETADEPRPRSPQPLSAYLAQLQSLHF